MRARPTQPGPPRPPCTLATALHPIGHPWPMVHRCNHADARRTSSRAAARPWCGEVPMCVRPEIMPPAGHRTHAADAPTNSAKAIDTKWSRRAAAGTRESPSRRANVPASSAASPATTAAAATTLDGRTDRARRSASARCRPGAGGPPSCRAAASDARARRPSSRSPKPTKWKWTARELDRQLGQAPKATSCRCSTKRSAPIEEADARRDRGKVGRTADRRRAKDRSRGHEQRRDDR